MSFFDSAVREKTELRRTVAQFLKFGIVGLSNTAVSMAVYYAVLRLNSELYVLGSVLGAILSIANAFFWNNRFVFTGNPSDFNSVLRRLGKTYVSYGASSALSVALIWVEVECFRCSKTIAPIVTLIITVPLNFFVNKFWTFRNDRKGSE